MKGRHGSRKRHGGVAPTAKGDCFPRQYDPKTRKWFTLVTCANIRADSNFSHEELQWKWHQKNRPSTTPTVRPRRKVVKQSRSRRKNAKRRKQAANTMMKAVWMVCGMAGLKDLFGIVTALNEEGSLLFLNVGDHCSLKCRYVVEYLCGSCGFSQSGNKKQLFRTDKTEVFGDTLAWLRDYMQARDAKLLLMNFRARSSRSRFLSRYRIGDVITVEREGGWKKAEVIVSNRHQAKLQIMPPSPQPQPLALVRKLLPPPRPLLLNKYKPPSKLLPPGHKPPALLSKYKPRPARAKTLTRLSKYKPRVGKPPPLRPLGNYRPRLSLNLAKPKTPVSPRSVILPPAKRQARFRVGDSVLAQTSESTTSFRPATVASINPCLDAERSYRVRYLEAPIGTFTVTEALLVKRDSICQAKHLELQRLQFQKGAEVLAARDGRYQRAKVEGLLPPSICNRPYIVTFSGGNQSMLRGLQELQTTTATYPGAPVVTKRDKLLPEMLSEAVCTSTTQMVDAGGRATLRNGAFKLILPAGATKERLPIGVTAMRLGGCTETRLPIDLCAMLPSKVTEHVTMAPELVDFTPSGTTFLKAVRISMRCATVPTGVKSRNVAIYCIGEQVEKKPMDFQAGDPVSVYSHSQRRWKHDGVSRGTGPAGDVTVMYGGSIRCTKLIRRCAIVTDLRHRGRWRYRWERCANNRYNPITGVVSATTTHFSLFCVTFSDLEAEWVQLPIKYEPLEDLQSCLTQLQISNWEKVHHGINFEVRCPHAGCISFRNKKPIFMPLEGLSQSGRDDGELALGQEIDVRTIIVERCCPACGEPIDPKHFQTLIVFNSIFHWRGETTEGQTHSGEINFLGTSHAHRSSLVETRNWGALFITPIQVGNRHRCEFGSGVDVEARHDGDTIWKRGVVQSAENGYYEIRFPDGVGRNYVNVRAPLSPKALGGSVLDTPSSLATKAPRRKPLLLNAAPAAPEDLRPGDMRAGRMIKSPTVQAGVEAKAVEIPVPAIEDKPRADIATDTASTTSISVNSYRRVIRGQAAAIASCNDLKPKVVVKKRDPTLNAGRTPCPSNGASPIRRTTRRIQTPSPPRLPQAQSPSQVCESSSNSSPAPLRRPSVRVGGSGNESGGSVRQESVPRGGGLTAEWSTLGSTSPPTSIQSYRSAEPDGSSVAGETPRGASGFNSRRSSERSYGTNGSGLSSVRRRDTADDATSKASTISTEVLIRLTQRRRSGGKLPPAPFRAPARPLHGEMPECKMPHVTDLEVPDDLCSDWSSNSSQPRSVKIYRAKLAVPCGRSTPDSSDCYHRIERKLNATEAELRAAYRKAKPPGLMTLYKSIHSSSNGDSLSARSFENGAWSSPTPSCGTGVASAASGVTPRTPRRRLMMVPGYTTSASSN